MTAGPPTGRRRTISSTTAQYRGFLGSLKTCAWARRAATRSSTTSSVRTGSYARTTTRVYSTV
jgi:hypothetical protein